MTGVKESLVQSRAMVTLFGERANLLEKLAELDDKINKVERGQVVVAAPKVDAPKAAAEPAQAPKRGRGRPKGSKNKIHKNNGQPVQEPAPVMAPAAPAPVPAQQAAPAPVQGKRFRNVDKAGHRLSLKELIISICSRHRNGIKLDELTAAVYKHGYQSTSEGKKFVQNIRTNLHTLMNSGVIVKDEDKRYYKRDDAPVAEEAVAVEEAVAAT